MPNTLRDEDALGTVLIQVQDDLRKLRCSLEKITVSEKGNILDVQVLDDIIRKTEGRIRKHAEDYMKTVSKQLLVLPCIEDLHKKHAQIPKWKPAFESFPDLCPQREDILAALPGEKHKSALTRRLLCNPAHPNNRAVMHQKFGIPLPAIQTRRPNPAKQHRIITGPASSLQAMKLKSLPLPEPEIGTGLTGFRSHKQLKWEKEPGPICRQVDEKCTPPWTTKTPPPTMTSRIVDDRIQSTNSLTLKSPQNLAVAVPVTTSKYPFTIIKGRIEPLAADFCFFRQSFSSCWSTVADALEALEKLLRGFAVPLAQVSGEKLAEISHRWDNGWRKAPPTDDLLTVLENREEVLGLVSRPGQRYKGEGGVEAAAVYIQSCWRRYEARTAYLRLCHRKWAARTIAMALLMRAQLRRVTNALQARRLRQLENYRSRAEHLAANWKHIQSSKRTIIHIPSLGYSQSQRQKLRRLDILQNVQISRLFDIRDKNVEVIYLCPLQLGEDILEYYTSLLKCDGVKDGADNGTTQTSFGSRRFIVLTPEAVDHFPTHNMCLSTLLKYSPRTLKRIRNLIQGKQAYIVGGVAHADDLAVADELKVPLLAPEPVVAQLYSTKSGGRRIFTGAEVDVPPGRGDIYSLDQLHQTLAELITQNMDVQRWLFKMDSEHGGRGTAYCDVCHLSCHKQALQECHRYGPQLWNTKAIQESVMLRYLAEIPRWLARYARPAQTSRYTNWAGFLKTFLRQGGVLEAYPPSDSITCLTVDLLLEPGGEVTVVSCGDQLHGTCQLKTMGFTVPQSSVHPETLHSICVRVGQACLQHRIIGYVSMDLVTFLDRKTMEQKVWAIDLDVTYSDQLAMTQMLLKMTGGTLNCRAACLEVPVSENCCEHQAAVRPPLVNCYAVIGSHFFHSNLSMLYSNVFLKMCKAHGIGFNKKKKQGTVLALYDSSERCRLGMITVSNDLRGALVTFARNLSVIHQEISASKMQGETNFKELMKSIEEVLQMIVQNRMQAVMDKTAT